MLPKSRVARPVNGQTDHIDAWLISYADLITLLFMVFVIFVSVSSAKSGSGTSASHGEPPHPILQKLSGTLALGTPFDETYRALSGIVTSNHADQDIAVEKTTHGVTIDLSVTQFFKPGSAEIPPEQLPLLHLIAQTLKEHMTGNNIIEVEGHTDDAPPENSPFANDWELSSMRAARITSQLADDGIDPASLRATGYAGNHPLVPNKDSAGHIIPRNKERNQRIIIRLESIPEVAPAADTP